MSIFGNAYTRNEFGFLTTHPYVVQAGCLFVFNSPSRIRIDRISAGYFMYNFNLPGPPTDRADYGTATVNGLLIVTQGETDKAAGLDAFTFLEGAGNPKIQGKPIFVLPVTDKPLDLRFDHFTIEPNQPMSIILTPSYNHFSSTLGTPLAEGQLNIQGEFMQQETDGGTFAHLYGASGGLKKS